MRLFFALSLKRTLLIGLLLVGFMKSNAQYDACDPGVKAFQDGERISYNIRYNWGRVWVSAGRASFSVTDTTLKGKPYYHFIGVGSTYEKYDWFYKVRDTYQSFALKEKLRPLRFKRDVQEGKNIYFEDNVFDHSQGNVYALSSEKRRRKDDKTTMDTVSIGDCVYDVLTALYLCRGIDFDGYSRNDTIPIKLFLDGMVHSTYLVYEGRRTYTTSEGKIFDCIRFKPKLIKGSIFSADDEMTVWVTDDKNRIPIFVSSEIVVGEVKAYLEEAKGLEIPLESSPAYKGKKK